METLADRYLHDVTAQYDHSIENHFNVLSAAQNGRLEEVQLLLKLSPFSSLTEHISSAANHNLIAVAAAAGGHQEIVEWLVTSSGLPIDLSAQHNSTLKFAIESGNLELVRWLVIDSKQSLNVVAEGHSAERLADEAGFKEIKRFLSTVSELHHVGVSIDRIQEIPELVDLVQSGEMPAEYASWLSDEDLEIIVKRSSRTASEPVRGFRR